MRVGVDIDNTLNDISQSIARQLDPLVGTDTEALLKEHLWISKAVGWTEEEVESFFDLHAPRIHQLAELKDHYTKWMLKGLRLRNMDLFIVTNRDSDRVRYDIEQCTHDWMAEKGLHEYFSDVHFTPGCKSEYCAANDIKIDVMVEDSPERAEAFLESGIPVVLFDYPYNRHLDHPNLYRVQDWWGAFQALVTIQSKEWVW